LDLSLTLDLIKRGLKKNGLKSGLKKLANLDFCVEIIKNLKLQSLKLQKITGLLYSKIGRKYLQKLLF